MLACFLAALAWLAPHLAAPLALDHRPAAVQQRLQAAQWDNDIAAITRAAPQVTRRQAGRWFISGEWLDAAGGGPFWRPLISCLWWLEYRLWGPDTALYSLATVVLVALTAALLAGATAAICRSLLAGAATAALLLWKVAGPLSGLISWFPAQTEVLAGFWLVAALLLLALGVEAQGRRQPLLLGLSLLGYLLAVLSKESALAFPLPAVVLLWVRQRRGGAGRLGPLLRGWIAAYALLGLALLGARTAILGGAGHFLVSAGPGHLLARALFVLAGGWLGWGLSWPAVGCSLLAAAALFVALRFDLARRRPVAYGLVIGLPLLLALAAQLTMGSPLVLLLPEVWQRLGPGVLFLLAGALAFLCRPRQAAVLASLVVACSLQLTLVPDWLRPHYFYLPALAWAALDGLVVAAAWQCLAAGWPTTARPPAAP